MVNKKMNIRIRKNAGLMGLVMSIILVLGIFTAMFNYWQVNLESSGQVMDEKYNQTYQNLSLAQDDLDNNVNKIKANLDDMKEAESSYQVAWNGLKGLGNTLKLPINFLNTALATYTAFDYSIDFIPKYIKVLITIGITAFVVFLILGILRGRN